MKKKILMIVIIIVLIIIGLVTLKHNNSKTISEYETMINKTNNKETFILYLYNTKNQFIDEALDYYKDTYSLKIDKLETNLNNSDFKKLTKKLAIILDENNTNTIIYIENGKVKSSVHGDFRESNIKTFLLNSHIIDSSYKNIDMLAGQDFQKYYKSNNRYCVLYINANDKDLYKYRKLLVDNKIKSLVLYNNSINSTETSKLFDKELKLGTEKDKKLPVVINIQNNKILSHYTNVTLDNLVDKCKS